MGDTGGYRMRLSESLSSVAPPKVPPSNVTSQRLPSPGVGCAPRCSAVQGSAPAAEYGALTQGQAGRGLCGRDGREVCHTPALLKLTPGASSPRAGPQLWVLEGALRGGDRTPVQALLMSRLP